MTCHKTGWWQHVLRFHLRFYFIVRIIYLFLNHFLLKTLSVSCYIAAQGTKTHRSYEQQSNPMSWKRSSSLNVTASTWKGKHVGGHVSFSPHVLFLLWKIELAGGTLSSLCLLYDDHPPPSFYLCFPLPLFWQMSSRSTLLLYLPARLHDSSVCLST